MTSIQAVVERKPGKKRIPRELRGLAMPDRDWNVAMPFFTTQAPRYIRYNVAYVTYVILVLLLHAMPFFTTQAVRYAHTLRVCITLVLVVRRFALLRNAGRARTRREHTTQLAVPTDPTTDHRPTNQPPAAGHRHSPQPTGITGLGPQAVGGRRSPVSVSSPWRQAKTREQFFTKSDTQAAAAAAREMHQRRVEEAAVEDDEESESRWGEEAAVEDDEESESRWGEGGEKAGVEDTAADAAGGKEGGEGSAN